jgi:hypothetical protein
MDANRIEFDGLLHQDVEQPIINIHQSLIIITNEALLFLDIQ